MHEGTWNYIENEVEGLAFNYMGINCETSIKILES
jgi:hypothetical protein